MTEKPLTDRELKRLAKMDRRLKRGRLRFGLFGLTTGFLGGLGWVAIMALMLPGFAGNMHFKPPTGDEQHAVLEQILYTLSLHFGPLVAICLVAGGMFGLLSGALSFGVAWRQMVKNHADLAQRALAFGQFMPAYASPLLPQSATRA
jgi:hypothetical protein